MTGMDTSKKLGSTAPTASICISSVISWLLIERTFFAENPVAIDQMVVSRIIYHDLSIPQVMTPKHITSGPYIMCFSYFHPDHLIHL